MIGARGSLRFPFKTSLRAPSATRGRRLGHVSDALEAFAKDYHTTPGAVLRCSWWSKGTRGLECTCTPYLASWNLRKVFLHHPRCAVVKLGTSGTLHMEEPSADRSSVAARAFMSRNTFARVVVHQEDLFS